jgi:hypothetical protein
MGPLGMMLTTCEELTHPWRTDGPLAARNDEAARREGVCVLTTGADPGFMMDTLPLTLTACAVVLNAVSRIREARHGLMTMVDIPPVSCYSSSWEVTI